MFERLLRKLGMPIRDTATIRHEPSLLCCGRDALSKEVVRSTFDHGCVLLFGGRQSGKTTTLRNIARQLTMENEQDSFSYARIPVFVDLMRLPYDATPATFFSMLAQLSLDACAERVPIPDDERNTASRVTDLESFETAITRLRSRMPTADLRFAYLLDESKRIIGDRFPRGFHDNLFHVLFGSPKIQGICNIVFSGAQELYRLCEDDTSPIGSRAAKHCLNNLSPDAVTQIARHFIGQLDEGKIKILAQQVFDWTGGHAGLSAGLLRAVRARPVGDTKGMSDVVLQFQKERSELFQLWVHGLTMEARQVHDALLEKGTLRFMEIVELLRRGNFGVHRSDRVADELQYIGLARREDDVLVSCNRIYSEVARLYTTPTASTALERSVWPLVEQTEVGLRRLVRVTFDKEWGKDANQNIRLGLGEDAWSKVLENRDKYSKSYPRSGHLVKSDEILDFTYLGQLSQLMIWKKSWNLFKHLFRDKRELEDIIRDILPVRNDGAHFRSVPELELDRCRIRCIDLLMILERNRVPTGPE